MSHSRGLPGARLSLLAAAAAALTLPAAARAASREGGYIVELEAKPLASYQGGVRGIPGTSPRVTGRKLEADSAPGLDYREVLAHRERAALGRVSGPAPRVVYRYRNAFAGFSARMTAEQAAELRRAPEVARVVKDELMHIQQAPDDPDTRLGGPFGDGASYLRLTDAESGLWNRLGGPTTANGAGAGVIVGDLDTGIQPGHPSFADRPGDGYIGAPFTAPPVWDGACQAGDGFKVTDCNNKLIGARYYVDGFGRQRLGPGSFLSPRDDEGHGSHTASTAAGNYGVDPSISGNDLGIDVVSGIAPRAYVAAYKVCWQAVTSADSGCADSDAVAAIDDAVADGVDVINYSISGAETSRLTATELAFLGASDAGVFVANSAGNDGPGTSTVDRPGNDPWLTTVAADTLHRTFTGTATITQGGASFTVSGAAVGPALPDTPLVDAAGAGLPGVPAARAELCEPSSLDPAKVAGMVVLCLRGDNDRVDKSHNVQLAGGAGMILYNASSAQELATDTHYVPSVHVSFSDGRRIKAAIAAGGASSALSAGRADTSQRDKGLAAFSSRGPQRIAPDLPKPDVTAPGVNILAAAADSPATSTNLAPGQLFQSLSGTSMAAPHVAGAAALLKQLHATFSPAELKSSLMTTANPAVKLQDGVTAATLFDAGAGEIDPNRAADPGLVLDVTGDEYLGYAKAVYPSQVSDDVAPIRPTDLNLPSIGISQFAGRDSTTRRFVGVDSTATRWTADAEGLPGITVTPSPSSFTVRPGQAQSVELGFQEVDAPLNQWDTGALVLRSGDRTVRLPIAIRPILLSAPATATVATRDGAGTQDLTVQPGYTGTLSALGFGLAKPSVAAQQRRISATTGVLHPGDPGTQLYPFTVPDGAQLISGRISDVDPATDLDLFLLRDPNGDADFSDAVVVSTSATATAAEAITRTFPAPGSYAWGVVGFTTRPGGSAYDFTTWLDAVAMADDMTGVARLSVTGDPLDVLPGRPATLKLNWAAVGVPGLYLGVVTYHNGAAPSPANRIGTTVVELTRTAGGGGQRRAAGAVRTVALRVR